MENKENKEALEDTQKSIQKMLSKLIADEWLAGHIYKQFVLLVKPEQRDAICQPFNDIAGDELNDHFYSLVEFALQNGFGVPATYNDVKKLADKEDVKIFESCKAGEDAKWYIEKAMEIEDRALKTYDKYVDSSVLNKIPELQLIIKNNFYDEVEHLETFKFMLESIDAMQKFE